MARKHYLAGKGSMDIPFLLLTLLLTGIGLMMLFSASFPSAYYETGSAGYYFKRQAIFAAAGIVAMLVVGRFNYQRWRGAAKILMVLAIFLLLLVIIPGVGITKNNATRWLGVDGVLTFQPSEIAKLAVIVYFADSISKKKERMRDLREGVLPYGVWLAVIAVLMLLEPHLSGTILIVGTGAIMMAVGGMPAWLIGAGVGGVAAAAWGFVALVDAGIISYGASRINMWHDPWLDSSDDGYQMVQSLIAIGSGGLLGTGLGKGRQKFLYLPEESNDFIFSTVVMLANIGPQSEHFGRFHRVDACLALCSGMTTIAGSFVAAGKLHRVLPQKPVVLPHHNHIINASLSDEDIKHTIEVAEDAFRAVRKNHPELG